MPNQIRFLAGAFMISLPGIAYWYDLGAVVPGLVSLLLFNVGQTYTRIQTLRAQLQAQQLQLDALVGDGRDRSHLDS